MDTAVSQTVYFYERRPISCAIILAKLRSSRGHLDGLRPEELFPYDQDHYGGLAATDALAVGAQITNETHVADFCAGLGTVRYLSYKYGADVTGIELTPSRVTGAEELTPPGRAAREGAGDRGERFERPASRQKHGRRRQPGSVLPRTPSKQGFARSFPNP
jgi:hypothetical protein